MKADITPLAIGILIFLSSIISLKLGFSVAIIEILSGIIAGSMGLSPEEWMLYLANFIVGGLKVSIPIILSAFGLFLILFIIKILMKFLGVYFLARKYIPNGNNYFTLLMSTGLTFGTIASIFGLKSGLINQMQYSILVGVVITSAVIPTFIAQKWFIPVDVEDELDLNNGNKLERDTT